jgi:4-diphosphocytidyl-2-C-methyl-D-erythritol kinase
MTSVTLKAPAKVNLFLKILSRRKDGYHGLYTVFEKISLADTIDLKIIPSGIRVSSDVSITKRKSDNIAYKAAKLVKDEFGVKKGVSIKITKRIPMAAGLGGGSSDAASVILGMNRLFSLNIGKERMVKLASKLGADVPFFVSGHVFAIGRGTGGRLTPIDTGMNLWHLVIFPGFKSSTRDIYKAFDKSKCLTHPSRNDKIQPSFRSSTDLGALEAMLYNDLQCAAISENKVLGSIIGRLTSYLGKKVILSGSGSSVFCLYRTRNGAVKAGKSLARGIPAKMRKRWKVFVARTETLRRGHGDHRRKSLS